MAKKYGLIGPKGWPSAAFAFRSLSVRLGAALSDDRGKWILLRNAERNVPGRGAGRVFRMRFAGDGKAVPDFEPGQYVFLSFPGRPNLASPRPFIIASPPSESRWLELWAKDVDDWSGAAKILASSEVAAGAPPIRARIAGPFGRFSYLRARGTGRFVFLAGGMGGAPFLSMLRFMALADRELRVFLLWGARTRDDLFAASELEEAAAELRHFRYVPVFSHDPLWTGERGRLDREKLERLVPAYFGSAPADFEWNSASYWLCGPPAFGRDLTKTLRDLGVHRAAIHEERFGV